MPADRDHRRFGRLLREQWRLAAVIVVVCVIAATIASLGEPVRYRATASLLYEPVQAPALSAGSTDPARAVATLAALAETDVVLTNASSASKLSMKTLRGSVSAHPASQGDLIEIVGTAPNGSDAATRANAVANALPRIRHRQAEDVVQAGITAYQEQLTKLGKPTASNQATVTQVQGQLIAAQSQLAQAKGDVDLVQAAQVPTSSSSLGRGPYALIGLIAGLILATLVLLLRDGVDRKPRTGVELEELWQLPVVGTLRDVGANGRVPQATADSFRGLRSNLLLHGEGVLPQILLVTSAVDGEGKSAVAANLARALAAGGRRVVAVSADTRTTLDRQMAIESTAGLAEVLVHDAYPTDVVTRVPLDEHHAGSSGSLDLLTSDTRPHDLTTSLVSDAMLDLLDDLREEYEIVVIDAPPLLPASETALLARAPGIRMLVVAATGRASRREIERARERLGLARIQPLGLVVCGARGE